MNQQTKLFSDKKFTFHKKMLEIYDQEKRFETFFNNYAQIESLL